MPFVIIFLGILNITNFVIQAALLDCEIKRFSKQITTEFKFDNPFQDNTRPNTVSFVLLSSRKCNLFPFSFCDEHEIFSFQRIFTN